MFFTIEVRRWTEDLASQMSRMRQWLDDQRFEPDTFRHTVEGESVTIRVQFKVESEAVAFAKAFDGQLV